MDIKNIVKRIISIMIDLKVAVVNLPFLPFIFGYMPPLLSRHSEMNVSSYDKISSILKTTKSVVIGDTETLKTCHNCDKPAKWFFLNGVCTDKHVWQINANLIEKIFDVKVHSMHNPTNGIVHDLAECVFGRTFDMMDSQTRHLYGTLKHALLNEEKVIILAHSQGGIIISNIMEAMMDDEDLVGCFSKLEIYTFASAADEMIKGDYYCEHYANSLDYVARIGILEYHERMYGTLHKRFAAGHLLNVHYLNAFEEGKFGTNNRLSVYRKM